MIKNDAAESALKPVFELEGIWEEITAQLPDFRGRRMRLIVLPVTDEAVEAEPVKEDPRLAILREIDERARTIDPKPDPFDFLREGRSGAMWDCEPSEND
jgi:hypothetical protein